MTEVFSLESIVFIVVGMLLFSSISHYSKKTPLIPDVIWMLLFGILYGVSQQRIILFQLPELEIEPSLILHLFVPVLIFAASQKICLFHFRKVLFSTSILASL
jgi:CPA1 family monovalent cation:H+ antiporter